LVLEKIQPATLYSTLDPGGGHPVTIIGRYIFRELCKIFFIGTMVLTAVLFLDKILFLTEMIINKNVSCWNIFRILTYLSPAFLVITIPMGVLVGTLVTFSHLSADSEIVAMKATGISFFRMLRPVMLLSFLTYLITSFIVIFALPWGNQSFRSMVFKLLRTHAGYEIKEGIFNNKYNGMVLNVLEKDPMTQVMKGIFIADSTKKDRERIITAREGIFLTDRKSASQVLQLKHGTIHEREKKSGEYRLLSFDVYNLPIDIPDPTKKGGKLMRGNREMSIHNLMKKIRALQKKGKPCNVELVELHKKFSIPFTCLILGLIGAPLGVKSARAGRSGGFAVSLMIILFYYICLITGESLGGAGEIPPILAMWAPNLLILGIGLYLVKKTAREKPFVWLGIMGDFAAAIFTRLKRTLLKDRTIQV